MKKQDDYIAGPHHYRTHFWCGVIFGAGIGYWMGWQIFESGWTILMTAIVVSAVVAYSCGRWGDRAWHWIVKHLPWIS
jgi:hypothetical protein